MKTFQAPTPSQKEAIEVNDHCRMMNFHPAARWFCFTEKGQFVASAEPTHKSPLGSLLESFENNEHFGSPVLVDREMEA